MSNNAAKDEFGFLATDFQEDGRNHARAEPGSIENDDLDEASHLPNEEPEPVVRGKTKPNKDNSKLLIIGVIGAAVLAVGGLGWSGYSLFVPQQRAPMAQQQVRNPTSDFATVKSTPPLREESQIAPVQLGNERQVLAQSAVAPAPQSIVADGAPDLQTVVTRDGQQEPDDAFYDNIAKAAEANDADQKPSALVTQSAPVAQSQVQPAAALAISAEQNAQIAKLAEQMSKQSAENASVLDAVRELSRDLGAVRAKLDANDEVTKQLGQRVSDLGTTVETYQKTTQSKIDAAIKSAAESIVETGKKQKLVLVGGAIEPMEPRPIRRQGPRPAPKPVSAPAPLLAIVDSPKPERTAAVTTSAAGPSACQANTVSQNWKVKGVSAGAAYVRREDGEALLLRLDSEIPGFGRVKSFDPNNRTVCTTSGLIGR